MKDLREEIEAAIREACDPDSTGQMVDAVMAVLRDQQPVVWIRDLSSPQPHAVTNLRYCSVMQHEAGEHLLYVPLYTTPMPPSVPDKKTLDMLALMFDAYENGVDCYEDPDGYEGYVGKALRLDDEDFHAIADHLNKHAPKPEKET